MAILREKIMKAVKAGEKGSVGTFIFVLILLIGLFLVCLPRIHSHHYSPVIRQKAQFHSMEAGIELIKSELKRYPPSDANDSADRPYCGAMKLCEAMMGRDLLGFHPKSVFKQDATDSIGNAVYSSDRNNLQSRKGPYLPLESANAIRLSDIYGNGNTKPFPADLYVLGDTNKKKRPTGEKTGMPILYYKADPNGTAHDPNFPDDPNNIYDYRDNQAILELGVPGKPDMKHQMTDPKVFYEITRKQYQYDVIGKPSSYILVSAGTDGLYGTKDDVFNYFWLPHRSGGEHVVMH